MTTKKEMIAILIRQKYEMIAIARTCLEAIEAGGDRETGTMMIVKENLKLMLGEN